MDNKITKNRLSDFFAYEWVAIIVAIALFIAGWEVVYALVEVKLTPGQRFRYYYDVGLTDENDRELYSLTVNSISYDVLNFGSERISDEHDVLAERLSVHDGDVIFTNAKDGIKDEDLSLSINVRAKKVIDSFWVYRLDQLLEDAQKYLKTNFFKDEYQSQSLGSQDFTVDKIDPQKVKDVFLARMKGDNRFRTEEQKEQGLILEQERIEKLCAEVCDFAFFMDYAYEHEELLYRYTMYEQALEIAIKTDEDVQEIQDYYDANVAIPGQINAVYGININALKGGEGKSNPSEYVKLDGSDTAENVVMMVFEQTGYQPHLQFETISFMNAIIRECSNILDR